MNVHSAVVVSLFMKIIHILVAGLLLASTGQAAHADPAEGKAPMISPIVASSNGLTFDLFAHLGQKPGNLAFSPVSIAAALSMTWLGARGETAAQMQGVLHLAGTPDEIQAATGQLMAALAAPGQQVTLRIANRLFADEGAAIDPHFIELTRTIFGAPLEPLDFRHDAEAARVHINAWIAGVTNDRIKDLLGPSSIRPSTRLVLANAVYFLADWMHPFVATRTAPAPFHVNGKDAHDVATMHEQGQFAHAHLEGVALIDLPYQGGDWVMTIVLPDAVDGLDAVERRLSLATFTTWLSALAPTQVDLALPKVRIDPASPIELSPVLAAMGMPLAFDATRADFSGITGRGKERLVISDVFHKAFVAIDEKGTEAAAATGVVFAPTGMRLPAPSIPFKADHPYLFFLRQRSSGMILFAGRVSDPSR